MSNTKGKSVEELFNEALVPVEEWPYGVPDNWLWVILGTIRRDNNSFGDGNWILSENLDPDGEVRLIQLSDIGKGEFLNKSSKYISLKTFNKLGCTEILTGDILISRMAEPIARSCIVPKLNHSKLITAVDVAYLRENEVLSDKRFLNYFFNSIFFREQAESIARGTTRVRITRKNLGELPIPLPPLNEQKRIADKVERLLDKINQAKQLIQEAKETFLLRRSAILDKAFRGELTSRWREINYDVESVNTFEMRLKEKITKTREKAVDLLPPYQLPDGWKWIRVKDIALCKSGYAFKSENFIDTGIQLIRMGNLFKNKLNLERNPVFLPYDYDGVIINKYMVKSGDILLSLTGTKYKRDYGYAVRIEEQEDPLLLNQRILSMTPIDISDYFYYYLQSPTFRDMFFSFETGAVNQGNVSSVAVEHIYFPLPPAKEGIEIQNIIESLLEKENNTEELISIEDSLDTLSQTILSKAFRGELGTHDSTEKKAIELLREVLTNT